MLSWNAVPGATGYAATMMGSQGGGNPEAEGATIVRIGTAIFGARQKIRPAA